MFQITRSQKVKRFPQTTTSNVALHAFAVTSLITSLQSGKPHYSADVPIDVYAVENLYFYFIAARFLLDKVTFHFLKSFFSFGSEYFFMSFNYSF